MQFTTLVKKRNKFYFKVIALPILFLLLLLIIFLWPKKETLPIKYYLPVNTSFYLHLKEASWLPVSQDNSEFIDSSAISDLWQYQKELWGPYYINVKELVWFKVEQSFTDDAYLVRFSTMPDKNYLESLKKSHSDYNFYKLDKNILLVSKFLKEDVSFKQKMLLAEDRYLSSEAIIYFKKDEFPDFLNSLEKFINPILETEDIFVGLNNRSKRIDLLATQTGSNKDDKDFSNITLPENLDLALGFSSDILAEDKKAIFSSLIFNNFSSLPYNILAKEYGEGGLLDDKAIFEQADNWLMLSLTDFDQELLQFLNIIKVKELKKKLVDGTTYYELVADEQNNKEYELLGLKYRQIGDLYSFDSDNYHYLSNNEDFIKAVISKQQTIGDLLLCGDIHNRKIKDFIVINSDKLTDQTIKDYLKSKNISTFRAFSYEMNNFIGLSLCY